MSDTDIYDKIRSRLHMIETDYSVDIIFAVESGSRSWGFASPDSRHVVDFIYAHPPEWYLSIDVEHKPDVIEYDLIDDIDINGYDLRKALMLFFRSNPLLFEWLYSPLVYFDKGSFAHKLRFLAETAYSAEGAILHYRGMARNNFQTFSHETAVPILRYFHVLRPLLAIQWIELYRKPALPEFQKLLDQMVDDDLLYDSISELLTKTHSISGNTTIPRVKIINDFIESELENLEDLEAKPPEKRSTLKQLNQLFREILG